MAAQFLLVICRPADYSAGILSAYLDVDLGEAPSDADHREDIRRAGAELGLAVFGDKCRVTFQDELD